MSMKIKSIKNERVESKIVINVVGSVDSKTSVEQDMTLTKDQYGRWIATIALDDFPRKESPEEAAERLSQWLSALSKGIKKSTIKKMKLNQLTRHFH